MEQAAGHAAQQHPFDPGPAVSGDGDELRAVAPGVIPQRLDHRSGQHGGVSGASQGAHPRRRGVQVAGCGILGFRPLLVDEGLVRGAHLGEGGICHVDQGNLAREGGCEGCRVRQRRLGEG